MAEIGVIDISRPVEPTGIAVLWDAGQPGLGRNHEGRGAAAGGRGEGIQAGRGYLRKIPDRVGLRAGADMDCEVSVGYSLFPRKRESRIRNPGS